MGTIEKQKLTSTADLQKELARVNQLIDKLKVRKDLMSDKGCKDLQKQSRDLEFRMGLDVNDNLPGMDNV